MKKLECVVAFLYLVMVKKVLILRLSIDNEWN